MATEVKAPGEYNKLLAPKIFLGGAIDQGEAKDWQSEVVKGLEGIDCLVLNPRRDDWDASWEESIENAKFREQVEWELKAQEKAVTRAVTVKTKAKCQTCGTSNKSGVKFCKECGTSLEVL